MRKKPIRILMLVNWKVKKCEGVPQGLQPPDYYAQKENYWFFRYFQDNPEVDVVDISSFRWLERFEKNAIRFYIWQTIRILPKLHRYDIVISHGMQSAVVLSAIRRLFKTRAKHLAFDIGSFNSAAESGNALRMMQFASKSLDGVIYHTSSQLEYYKNYFPWLVEKSYFIRFGTDLDYFTESGMLNKPSEPYILCVGYNKRDWDTLVSAYDCVETEVKLRLIGHIDVQYGNIAGVEQYERVNVTQLIEQIKGAEFCVLPLKDYNYSFGQMTLMQQMALDKCVVVANVRSMRDYVLDGETAILYQPGNADDLAHKISFVLNNTEERDRVGKNARKWLEQNCNERIMAGEIERILGGVYKAE